MRAPRVPQVPGTPRAPKHNQTNKNTRESRQREKLLDQSKANYFKYDLQDILKASPVAVELHNSLIQTLWAKGSRDAVTEAKVWLMEKVKEKAVDPATQQRILGIMDRYSTWR
ncbi:MAG: hypothetical protein QOD77_847 [Thermoplasmata archaeon]|jgi:uncharacterized membrane protein YheB (UPF0754 family)|nr:hypothetical protein [Thermoplasmata archaeon]